MWSGPRNISTAMMRSWQSRQDTQVIDEPFYAFYLSQTQSPHPGFDEILASQSSDYQQLARQLSQGNCISAVQYQKHMTHHMLQQVDLSWTQSLRHCFLIRDPVQVVNSYTHSRGQCSAIDIGIIRQAELYQQISQISAQNIPIIDSNDVLKDPKGILTKLCERLEIPYADTMLKWATGARSSDGIWAKHWYASVEQSTGFSPFAAKAIHLNEQQQQVVNQVQPYYQQLYKNRITL
jgi:hypothetical protein